MPVPIIQPDTVLDLKSEPQGRIEVYGERNSIRVGRNVVLTSTIWLVGSGMTIEIGDDCNLNGMIRAPRGDGGLIRIGRGTTFNAVGLSLHEPGEIIIGEDCMFSTDIHADVSDMHPIFDRKTGIRINPAKSIHVADHVWIGAGVRLLKGATIGSGSVLGAGSMVSGDIPPNVLAVGSPAKVVREDIAWRREFDDVAVAAPQPPQGFLAGAAARLRRR